MKADGSAFLQDAAKLASNCTHDNISAVQFITPPISDYTESITTSIVIKKFKGSFEGSGHSLMEIPPGRD
jgi:hypothetical protein